ncbi:MAG: hypothetical protein LH473_13080 [Chitinophagales bacterium]|nr:hypothetical protein [Chitinophagales bacterium]
MKLEDYKARKLIDLLFKFLPAWRELSKKNRKWFFQNANSPLDSFSLSLLKQSSSKPEITSLIQEKPTMSTAKKDDCYSKFQKEIKFLMKNQRGSSILFDLLAWEMNHSKMFSLQKKDTK